jgi:hypothetical protein
MATDRQPAHFLTLAHALIQHLIDRRFGCCGQGWFATTMSRSLVDRQSAIASDILNKITIPIVKLRRNFQGRRRSAQHGEATR